MNNDDYDDVEGMGGRKNRGQNIPLQNRVSNVYGTPLPAGVSELYDELKNEMTKRSEEIRKRFMAEIRKIKLQSIAFWVFGVLSSILSGALSAYLLISYSGHTISSNNQPLSQGI